MRGEALDFLQLPVSVKYGRVGMYFKLLDSFQISKSTTGCASVGHIQISVSWTKLSTVPVVITLEDVYVVAAPVGSERRAKDAAVRIDLPVLLSILLR